MVFSFLDLLLITLTAAAVGGLSGFFGVGGACLLVPLLNIVLGIPVEMAVGACAFQILGLSTTSLLARRIKVFHLRLPLILAGGLFCGVLVGAQGLQMANSLGQAKLFGREIDIAQLLVLSVYCQILTAIGVLGLWETGRGGLRPRKSSAEFPAYGVVSILGLSWLGLATGGLSGLLGISGGLILLPALTYLVGMKTQDAVISSLIIVWIASAQATAVHSFNGNVDLVLALALLLGGTVGARIGSEIGLRTKGRELRRRFAYLLLATAALIAARLAAMFVMKP